MKSILLKSHVKADGILELRVPTDLPDEWRTTPMMILHAQIIKKNGKKEYAVLPYEEFLKVREELEDYEDLRCLREAREAERDAPTIGMAELKKKMRKRTRSLR